VKTVESGTTVVPFKGTARRPIRPPFTPVTGNPEAHNYGDWAESMGFPPLNPDNIKTP
jgi:hypothetical protein